MTAQRIPAGTPRTDGVVLLHGISRTARSFRKMQAALERLRLRHAEPGLREPPQGAGSSWPRTSIRPSKRFADRHRRLASISSAIPWAGCWRASIIGRYRPKRLGRVVMLGTPNGGSEIADRLKNFEAYRASFRTGRAATHHPAGCGASTRCFLRSIIRSASSRETGRSDPMIVGIAAEAA